MNFINLNCGMKKFINNTWPLGDIGLDPRKVIKFNPAFS